MPNVLSIAQVGPILRLFAELLPSLALGFWLGRIKPHWTRPLASPLVRFGVPMSVMGFLLKGGVTWNLAGIALTAALAIGLWMLGMQLLPKLYLDPCSSFLVDHDMPYLPKLCHENILLILLLNPYHNLVTQQVLLQ